MNDENKTVQILKKEWRSLADRQLEIESEIYKRIRNKNERNGVATSVDSARHWLMNGNEDIQ